MSNVIKEYQAKKTSFSQSLVPISEHPTVVICLEESDTDYVFEYGKEIEFKFVPYDGNFKGKFYRCLPH